MSVSLLAVILLLGILGLAGVLVAVVVLIMTRQNQDRRTDEPKRTEHVERISREIEKINEMQAAGRVSAEEAAELKLALESERREWSAGCTKIARKRLTRSHNSVLGGVCGGLAEWLDCDVTLIRIIYVALTVFLAAIPGLILYILMWLIMPPPDPVAPRKGN